MNELFPRTQIFDLFCSPRIAFWRILVGILLITAIYAAFAFASVAGLIALLSSKGIALGDPKNIEDMNGETPLGILIILFSFIGGWVGVIVVNAWLHRLPLRRLLSADGDAQYRHFAVAAIVAIAFALTVSLLTWLISGETMRRSELTFRQWGLFLPLALPLIALQTGAEELVFRGYLQGRLGARFRSPLVWAVLPSILFGALHYSPAAYGDASLITCLAITTLALVFAGLTARTGSLWAAWGAHFGINTIALLVIGQQGWLSGLSLWLAPQGTEALMTGALIVHLGAALGGTALLLWLDRRVRKSRPAG